MLDEFLKELKEKYNYSDELMNAIRISIPVMVDTYGEDSIEEILNLFNNVRIFATDDMSSENREKIRQEMIQGRNKNIEGEYSDPYCSSTIPGSYYSFEAIFDDNMDVIDEVKWLVVDENTYQAEGYKKIFGTTINIPYFLHELNHAFAMQKPVYKKENNILYTKHGMFEDTYKIEGNKIIPLNNTDVILEEMITELYTQRQLVKLLEKENYKEVDAILSEIHHIKTSYIPTIITVAAILEASLGKEMLTDYRKNNNLSVKEYFNSIANKSSIKDKYFKDIDAWDFISKKSFEIFQLTGDRLKYIKTETGPDGNLKVNIDPKYKELQVNLYEDALAPLYAFREFKKGDVNLEVYEKERNEHLESILGDTKQQNKTK